MPANHVHVVVMSLLAEYRFFCGVLTFLFLSFFPLLGMVSVVGDFLVSGVLASLVCSSIAYLHYG